MKFFNPLFFVAFLIGCSSGNDKSNESSALHNGIVLPEVWPPRYEVPDQRQEMPLPYIDKKPEVIPVNLGRQLFVDDFLISSIENLEKIPHHAVFYAHNPILQPDKEWEMTFEGSPYAAPFSDGIWYDERDNKYKMWYLAGAGMLHKHKQSFYTCYAESDDGKHWNKVERDVYPHTNIVDTCDRDAATVWLDKRETDPSKRYKLFNVEKTNRGWQIVLKYSADGIHWSNGEAQSGSVGDRTTAFYNPFTDKWVISLRYGNKLSGRSRAYLEHEDPEMAVSLAHHIRNTVKDRNIVFWFSPDDKELHHPKFPEVEPAIYNFDAIAYESVILGFYAMWKGPENDVCDQYGIQKRNEIGLGYSRDGFHFYRPDHSAFVGVNETEGAWNWGNMQSINGVPLIVGDSLYFYSSGRMKNDIMWDGHVSTGLATLRRDGFISMRAGNTEGFLVTEKLSFDGKYFFVNADVRNADSALAIELLDEAGKPISGFTKEDCLLIKGINSTKQMVTWKGHKDLSSLEGRAIRVKFYLQQGDLYSFWISPWETGESRGYTAGGGPGLNEGGVDIP